MLKAYFPLIIWALIILILSGYPGNHIPKVALWQFDKLIHSVIYLLLAICLLLSFNKQYIKNHKRFQISLIVILVASFYGGLMEFLQDHIFINRSGNWFDFIANTIGVFFGVLIYPITVKYLPINRWLKIN